MRREGNGEERRLVFSPEGGWWRGMALKSGDRIVFVAGEEDPVGRLAADEARGLIGV